jgi:hypothetical protein
MKGLSLEKMKMMFGNGVIDDGYFIQFITDRKQKIIPEKKTIIVFLID